MLRLEIFISQKAQRAEDTMLHADSKKNTPHLLDVDLHSFYGMRDREITSLHFEATPSHTLRSERVSSALWIYLTSKF